LKVTFFEKKGGIATSPKKLYTNFQFIPINQDELEIF